MEADASWWHAVSSEIARQEYFVSRNEHGLQAPNRAQNLRTYFGIDGIDIAPRQGGTGTTTRVTWRTSRWGRAGGLVPVEPATTEPQVDGARVTYARSGFEEWYENRAEGIEQGFTVRERRSGSGPLIVAGRFGGGVARLHEADGAVDLLDNHGARLLRYGGLVARDAANHELASQLRVDGSEVAIVIDDAGATYPVSIDPVMTAPAWTAESDQAAANFGISVATAGDVNGDGFSDVIVGAWTFDDGQVDEGRAFLYLGSAAGLALTPSWTAEGDQTGAFFGTSVATAGDVNGDGFADVMVGAPQFDNGQTDEGRAFVYHGSSSGLGASPAWTAEGDQATAYFGYGIGTAGDVNGDGFSDVIVGAEAYDNGQTDEGIAHVYLGSASGLAATPVWTVESNQAGAFFGLAVGTAGDVNGDGFSDVIVGAPAFTNGQSGEGRAFVYHGSPSGPIPLPAWTAESDQAGASFGYSVATAGDVNGDGFSDVIVGAYNYDNGETNEGRAYVYFGSGIGLAPSPAWTRESDQASAGFGVSVATAGDVNGDGFADVIVGAYRYDNGETDEGRAFVYHGSAAGPSTARRVDRGVQPGMRPSSAAWSPRRAT